MILDRHDNGTVTVSLRLPEMTGGKVWDAGINVPADWSVGHAVDTLLRDAFREVLA